MTEIDGVKYETLQHVAERRGVSLSTVKSAVRRGHLKSYTDMDLKRRLIKTTDADSWNPGDRPGRKKSPATEEEKAG